MNYADGADLLWLLFCQHYDDWIMHPQEDEHAIYISARTLRVLEATFGADLLRRGLAQWAAEGSIAVFGSPEKLSADQPCIRVLDYVSRIEPQLANVPPPSNQVA